jgi:hypothetical protein
MAARKTAARKKTARKKTTARKAPRKKTGARKQARKTPQKSLATELPKSFAAFRKELNRDLTALEREVEAAGKDTRRRLTRLVREASHHLGHIEARGASEWKKLSAQATRDVERTMRRVKKAIS